MHFLHRVYFRWYLVIVFCSAVMSIFILNLSSLFTNIIKNEKRIFDNRILSNRLPVSLLARNQNRLDRLKKYYSQFLNLSSFNQPKGEKTMIYSCSSICFGWGDRLRGITSVYILALLTRRRFMIDMNHPCSISHVLQPYQIDWRFQNLTRICSKNRTQLIINVMPLRPPSIRTNMMKLIKSQDFYSLRSEYDDIHITTNAFYITHALRNPFTNASWLLGNLPLKQATQELLFPLLFELLFKPSLIVRRGVEQILQRSHRQLTCLHLRFGRNPSNPFDVQMSQRENLTKVVLEFLDNNPCLVKPNETLLYITSDSDQAIQTILKSYPTMSITVPGPILHIDYANHSLSQKSICNGFIKVVTDFYILGECDISILCRSGFSLWANRRRLDRNSQLFLYRDDLNRIKKIKSMS